MASAAAPAQTAGLGAAPSSVRTTLAEGTTRLPGGAIAYRPNGLPGRALPMALLLHGAGGSAAQFLNRFKSLADKHGLILVAQQSAGPSWDIRREGGVVRLGRDVPRIDRTLGELFARTSVETGRSVVIGFSDGASYGLSLALDNPQLFAGVVALSPGYLLLPDRVDRRQRIYIAHGRADQILPFSRSSEQIVPRLTSVGMSVKFAPFEGGHGIDRERLDAGVAYVIGGTPVG